MNTLYPIIRRVRRALLPPEEVRLVEKVEPPSPQPSDSVAPAPSALPGDDQSLLTSAATKARKGQRVAAKSRVKAIDEAHSDQP